MTRLIPLLFSFFIALTGIASADGLKARECPTGKFLFEQQPIPDSAEYYGYKNKKFFASVLIRGGALETEKHLFTRTDGWTHLSSEKTLVGPLERVANCLPRGKYDVRKEYYTRVPFIGDWLLHSVEYTLLLDRTVFAEETLDIWAAQGMYREEATFADHLRMHWPLFAVYTILPALFFATLIVIIRTIRKGERK